MYGVGVFLVQDGDRTLVCILDNLKCASDGLVVRKSKPIWQFRPLQWQELHIVAHHKHIRPLALVKSRTTKDNVISDSLTPIKHHGQLYLGCASSSKSLVRLYLKLMDIADGRNQLVRCPANQARQAFPWIEQDGIHFSAEYRFADASIFVKVR